MNKLEEHKWNQSEIFADKHYTHLSSNFRAGFDAAIALDLPVKFAKWINSVKYVDPEDLKVRINPELVPIEVGGKTEELYQYWIDNIYKPE